MIYLLQKYIQYINSKHVFFNVHCKNLCVSLICVAVLEKEFSTQITLSD